MISTGTVDRYPAFAHGCAFSQAPYVPYDCNTNSADNTEKAISYSSTTRAPNPNCHVLVYHDRVLLVLQVLLQQSLPELAR